jgi:hypothetical protein
MPNFYCIKPVLEGTASFWLVVGWSGDPVRGVDAVVHEVRDHALGSVRSQPLSPGSRGFPFRYRSSLTMGHAPNDFPRAWRARLTLWPASL